jgi:DNA-binding transcriptional MerR regulator
MGELAEASGVPVGTIKHYLREGLLPEPVKTSRNMAYYPPEFVDRIKLIKQLQEERFMPLKAIKAVLDEDPERARAMVELEDRILERALGGERTRTSAAEVRERYGVPKDVLDRLEEIEVLSPNSRGYSPSDIKIIEAIGRFRAGGYDEQIGFTVYDTLRYKRWRWSWSASPARSRPSGWSRCSNPAPNPSRTSSPPYTPSSSSPSWSATGRGAAG